MHSGVLEAGYFLRKGTLRLSGTLEHRWAGGLEESSSDAFNDLQGFPVLRLDRGNYFEGVNARVSIPSGTPPTLASLLACLGLYMRLLMNKVYD